MVSLALFLVAPIVFIVIYSFWLRTAEGLDVPAFQFGNWVAVLQDRYYWLGLYSTFETSLITAAACAVIGYPTAYFLARIRFIEGQMATSSGESRPVAGKASFSRGRT